ncbi:MAG: ABC transporter substrate-binding protein [Actinomycetota bacterium]|nr:ABC transporter substrate-binding protein [Actinomycetota bacterium]
MAKRRTTWTILLTLLLAFSMLAAACGSDDEATGPTAAEGSCEIADLNLVTAGTLTVATGEPAFPPWVGTTDGEGFDDPESKLGFEAGLVYAIADELGFADTDVVWTRIGFNEAIAPGDKPWDFNLQQYSITADRDEIVDFSSPYYVTRQALVLYPDSPYASAKTTDDLKDAILGAQIGTTSLDFIEDVIKPNTKPNVYDENVDLEAAMKAGQIDGLVMDLPASYYVTAVQLEGAIIAGQFETEAAEPDEYGLLFADGNSLVLCVNSALETLKSNGTLQELEDTYLTQDGGIPTITG